MLATEPNPNLSTGESAVAATVWDQPALLHQSLDEFCRHGVLVTDTHLIVRHWNRWLEDRSGFSADAICGQSLLEIVPELAARGLHSLFQRALNGETAVLSQRLHRHLLPMPARVGTEAAVRMLQSARIAPLRQDGRIVGTVTVIEDVTERVMREEELHQRIAVQESLTEISRSILTLDLAECLQGLVNESAGLLGAELVAIVLHEQDALRLGARTAGAASDGELRLHHAGNVAARVLETQEQLRLADAHAAPEAIPALDPRSRSVVAAPLLADGEVIGVLVAEARRPDAFSAAEETLLLALAQHAAVAIQNGRLFAARSRSEERFRFLSASAPIGIFETDAAGHATYLNPHWLSITGLSLEEGLGEGWQRAVHPDDAARVFAGWQSAAVEGREFDDEFRFRRGGGEVRWVHARSVSVRSAAGQVTSHVGTVEDITERKGGEAELAKAHQELVAVSRQAGMAEVATGVLHNVGNVLNSANVSLEIAFAKVRGLKAGSLEKLVALLHEHAGDLPSFFTSHPQGTRLTAFLAQLSGHFSREQGAVLRELDSLRSNVEHINEIVAMQQRYAGAGGVIEVLPIAEVLEDALRMNGASLDRHGARVQREIDPSLPSLPIDRHRVLQILVNLIRNATHAMEAAPAGEKCLTLRASVDGGRRVRISVGDTGVGIPRENLARIFEHGFTTKKTGHGFGLHASAQSAVDLGGSLLVHSDGAGRGATFTLELPCPPQDL